MLTIGRMSINIVDSAVATGAASKADFIDRAESKFCSELPKTTPLKKITYSLIFCLDRNLARDITARRRSYSHGCRDIRQARMLSLTMLAKNTLANLLKVLAARN